MHHGTYSDKNTRVAGLRVAFNGLTGFGHLGRFTVLEDHLQRYEERDALMCDQHGNPIGEHTKNVQMAYRRGDHLTLDIGRVKFDA